MGKRTEEKYDAIEAEIMSRRIDTNKYIDISVSIVETQEGFWIRVLGLEV